MPVTDRDNYIIATALSYAIECIGRLPAEMQETSELEDMKKILLALCGEDFATQFRETARDLIEGREFMVSEIARHVAIIEERGGNVVPLRRQEETDDR